MPKLKAGTEVTVKFMEKLESGKILESIDADSKTASNLARNTSHPIIGWYWVKLDNFKYSLAFHQSELLT